MSEWRELIANAIVSRPGVVVCKYVRVGDDACGKPVLKFVRWEVKCCVGFVRGM